jgi:U3 small nucleolar RNA-associated protein 25
LIQSLTADAEPQAKKRKLEHPQKSKIEANKTVHSENEAEVDRDADEVEEEEEGPETALEGVLEEDSDEEDQDDPFDAHFADPDENMLKARLQSLQKGSWSQQRFSTKTGRFVAATPTSSDFGPNLEAPSVSGPGELKLKQKLAGVISKQRPKFDDLEKRLATYIFNYKDLMFCERSPSNSESLRRLTCLHAVNHVFK